MTLRRTVSIPMVAIMLAAALAALWNPSPSASAQTVEAQSHIETEYPVPTVEAEPLDVFPSWDAHQGVGVDDDHFYAVRNQSITQHDKTTGEPLLQFVGAEDGPIDHMDSAVVVKDKLYASNSNYPEWPMTSSIEVFDTRTMEHIDTHSFGIFRGSLTWLDRYQGAWWATFANYDRVQEGQLEPYGETHNTQVVKMDNDFQVLQSWTIPEPILDTFEDMSNSGGSWGPDGRLYLTGHDLPEAYVMQLPPAGGELQWIATVDLPGIEGQGIAWDRHSDEPNLWGFSRDNDEVTRFLVPVNEIEDVEVDYFEVRGPGDFQQ